MTTSTAEQHADRIESIVPQTVARVRTTATAARARVGSLGFVRRFLDRPGLAVLDEVHPGARLGTRLDLGVQAIEIADISGTAVGGPRLRGADFKPIDEARTPGWQTRYARLRAAFDRMVTLPPIEVYEVGGAYWVIDGHNRVALARELRLAFIDANVIGIRWAGSPALRTRPSSLGAVLEAGTQQRVAASDRWSGTSAMSVAAFASWRPPMTACGGCA